MPCLEPLLKRLFFYLINDRSQSVIEKAGGALQSLLGISCAPRGWTFVSFIDIYDE